MTTEKLFSFIENSPTAFHAIEAMRCRLKAEGYQPLLEGSDWNLQAGGKYYVIRNGSSIIAFRIPAKEWKGFQIMASHSDSPMFKIKENPEIEAEGHYVKLNVEKYGGMLCAPWFDRPLSVAGRLVVKDGEQIVTKLVDVKKDLVMIPSLAIHMNRVHGQEDFASAFAHSCNSAFAQIGVDLNRSEYVETVKGLLFNTQLPIDLPYRKCNFDLEANSADALTMQTAIGQGDTLVSPMYMAMLTSAVANGGNLMTPYLVEKIESYTGTTVKSYTPKIYKKLMTTQEASKLTELMTGVVESGTGSALSGRGYTAAGKTGTAEHGDVSSTTPHAWFVGFSNVEDPDIVVSVIAEESGSGSEVAVPIAQKIFDAYYNN